MLPHPSCPSLGLPQGCPSGLFMKSCGLPTPCWDPPSAPLWGPVAGCTPPAKGAGAVGGRGRELSGSPTPASCPHPLPSCGGDRGSAASRRTAVWPRRACSGQQPWPGLPLTSDVGWDGGGLGSPPYPLPALGCRPHLNPHPALCCLAAPQADLPPSAHELSSQAADLPILRPQAAPCHSDPQSPSLWQG